MNYVIILANNAESTSPIMQVTYQADLFLDKNKDYVVAEHQGLLIASKCAFVAGLFPSLSQADKSSKFSSIGLFLRYFCSFFFSFLLKIFME